MGAREKSVIISWDLLLTTSVSVSVTLSAMYWNILTQVFELEVVFIQRYLLSYGREVENLISVSVLLNCRCVV